MCWSFSDHFVNVSVCLLFTLFLLLGIFHPATSAHNGFAFIGFPSFSFSSHHNSSVLFSFYLPSITPLSFVFKKVPFPFPSVLDSALILSSRELSVPQLSSLQAPSSTACPHWVVEGFQQHWVAHWVAACPHWVVSPLWPQPAAIRPPSGWHPVLNQPQIARQSPDQ